jgi:hypothetical protein
MIDDTLRYEFQGISQIRKLLRKCLTCLNREKTHSISYNKQEEIKMFKRYDEQGAIVKYFMRDRIVPPKEFIKAAKDWENYQPQLQEALDAMRNAQERRRDFVADL